MSHLTAAPFIAQHTQQGHAWRWTKTTRCPATEHRHSDCDNGIIYTEMDTSAATKALFWEVNEQMQPAEFGTIPGGSTIVSIFPADAYLTRGDLLADEDATRLCGDVVVTRAASGVLDALPVPDHLGTLATSLRMVRSQSTSYTIPTQVRLNGNDLEWVSGAPAAGTRLTVEFLMLRAYRFDGQIVSATFPDKNGIGLPQHYALDELKVGNS